MDGSAACAAGGQHYASKPVSISVTGAEGRRGCGHHQQPFDLDRRGHGWSGVRKLPCWADARRSPRSGGHNGGSIVVGGETSTARSGRRTALEHLDRWCGRCAVLDASAPPRQRSIFAALSAVDVASNGGTLFAGLPNNGLSLDGTMIARARRRRRSGRQPQCLAADARISHPDHNPVRLPAARPGHRARARSPLADRQGDSAFAAARLQAGAADPACGLLAASAPTPWRGGGFDSLCGDEQRPHRLRRQRPKPACRAQSLNLYSDVMMLVVRQAAGRADPAGGLSIRDGADQLCL